MMLMTGATGTVGSAVVKRLSAQGVQVRAVTRDPQKADAPRLPHVQCVQGDFEDGEAMRRACADVDRAFLLTNSTARTEHQQIAFTRVAHQSGVRHIVTLSQLHADTRAPGRFLRSHAAVEAAVQAAGLTFTFLRPTLSRQGLLHFRQSIQAQRAFFAAAGDARISAVDVRDLADVAVAALTTAQHDNTISALTGPDALTCAEMAHQLSQAGGDDALQRSKHPAYCRRSCDRGTLLPSPALLAGQWSLPDDGDGYPLRGHVRASGEHVVVLHTHAHH